MSCYEEEERKKEEEEDEKQELEFAEGFRRIKNREIDLFDFTSFLPRLFLIFLAQIHGFLGQ